MFTAQLEDGSRITGEDMHWHALPAASKIASLGAQISMKGDENIDFVAADDVYSGFDAYGFQMYDLQTPQGVVGRGVQLLCVSERAGAFLTVDINLGTGQRRCQWQPLARMTYNRSLLRPGTGC